MYNMIYYCFANVNFDRFGFATSWQRKRKTPSIWVLLFEISKKYPLPRIPLTSTVKQHPIHWGFFTSAALRALSSRNHTGADKCGRFTDKPSGKNCWCTRIHKQANKVTLAFSSRYERLIIRICTSIIKMG